MVIEALRCEGENVTEKEVEAIAAFTYSGEEIVGTTFMAEKQGPLTSRWLAARGEECDIPHGGCSNGRPAAAACRASARPAPTGGGAAGFPPYTVAAEGRGCRPSHLNASSHRSSIIPLRSPYTLLSFPYTPLCFRLQRPHPLVPQPLQAPGNGGFVFSPDPSPRP